MTYSLPKLAAASLAVCVALPTACSYDFDQFAPTGATADASAGQGGSAGSGATAGASGASGGGAGASGEGGASGGSAGASGGSAGASGGSAGASGGTGGGSGGTGGGPVTVNYAPAVADCVALTAPDPDFCEQSSGSGEMSVDGADDQLAPDGGAPPEVASFMRFNLDGAIAGKTVTKVELELTATPTAGSDGPQAGEIWRVSSFTRPALFSSAPTKQGGAALAASQGPVVASQVLTWTLPNSAVQANAPLYLGVFATSLNGVRYYNTKGASPPKLSITVGP